MQWFLALSTLTVLYALSTVWAFAKPFLAARKSGFPSYLSPANPSNPIWMISQVFLRPILANILPAAAFERINIAIYGWEFRGRYATHAKYEASFMYVTPGANELWVADEEIANAILARRNDFLMPDVVAREYHQYFLAPNLLTSNGEDWQRQRKLVAPNLNERIMGLVWAESSAQAEEMLEYFTPAFKGETSDTIAGLRAIAMNVLGSAGYGTPQPWRQETKVSESGYQLTYVDAVSALINNIIAMAVIPAVIFSLPIMPDSVRIIGIALREFPLRTKEMLEAERKSASSDASPRNNMMSTLVRLSDSAKRSEEINSNSQHLSEDEILGNLFQFTAAGFDTTANTMAYAVTILAIETEWQDWIIEEIDKVGHTETGGDYAKIFPKLSRCLALMYETLRLYTPVLHITRSTNSQQILTKGPKTYVVPANTLIYINNSALHTNPRIWGADSLVFRPTRWLSQDSASEDVLVTMPRGTFVPWSGGPRVCPGQKMSQVEFVAVIMTIFSRYTVAPVAEKGETMEEAKERLRRVMGDSQPRLTLQMNNPQEVKLKWSRR